MFCERGDHLMVVEQGNPRSTEEMTRYFAAIERAMASMGARLLFIVAATTGANPASPEWKAIRDERWRAMAASRATRIGVLVEDEIAAARVNMTAVAMKAHVRAFADRARAIEWLRGGTIHP